MHRKLADKIRDYIGFKYVQVFNSTDPTSRYHEYFPHNETRLDIKGIAELAKALNKGTPLGRRDLEKGKLPSYHVDCGLNSIYSKSNATTKSGQVWPSVAVGTLRLGAHGKSLLPAWGNICGAQIPIVSLTRDGEKCVPSLWPK